MKAKKKITVRAVLDEDRLRTVSLGTYSNLATIRGRYSASVSLSRQLRRR